MNRTTQKRFCSLFLTLVMVCNLFMVVPASAEEIGSGTEATTVTFDISKGSVTADANGVTGYTADGTDPTIVPWDEVANRDIVVTGTSAENNYIKLDSGCSSDLTLTLRDASITTNPAQNSDYSPIHNLTNDKTLTVKLEGTNTLHAKNGRVLWVAGSNAGIHFMGQNGGGGEKATLTLTSDASGVSLMVSKSGDTPTNGTFTFENCDVNIGCDFDTKSKNTASQGTNIRLASGAQVKDVNNQVYSNETLTGDVTRDISKGDITIGKEYKVSGTWTLTYEDATNLNYIVTGESENNGRITVTDPDVNLTLRDLMIDGVRSDRSAFLVNYADPADYAKPLTVKVGGNVNFTTVSASTFNTYGSEKIERYNANVKLVGETGSNTDKVTITRRADTASGANVAALGVNLTAEKATVIINKNCNFDVTAGTGSTVYVAGTIRGKGTTQDGGSLLSGSFDYRFIEGGREYKAIADKSNENIPTLLLPGSADLGQVSMAITEGWTVKCGEETLTDRALPFASAEDNTLTLTINPSDALVKYGATSQTVKVRAIKSDESIPAVYLNINKGSMAEVEADRDHDTKAKGTVTILGADDLDEATMEIKGRGNASWKRAKKGYQIKLDQEFSVLDMGKSKKWILLPSSADLSMVRSAIGFDLAQQLDMEHAANWRFVDFYAEGNYYGLYILCEKVEVGDNRLDITNLDDVLEETIGKDKFLADTSNVTYNSDYSIATLSNGKEIDLTGGYHLELDNYDDPLQFSAGGIQRITVKEPEYLGESPKDDKCYTYIRNFMNGVGAAITGSDEEVLRQYVDLESFAQMWLLKQYMHDFDATNNMHVWKESNRSGDGLLHAGLAWDFDNSMCRDEYDLTAVVTTATTKTNFKGSGSAKWLKLLESHTAFQEELVRQYNLHKDLFTCCNNCDCKSNLTGCDTCDTCYVHKFAADQAESTKNASVMDTIRWYGTKFSNMAVNTENRAASLNTVKTFACARNTYLADRITGFNVELFDVTFESDGEEVVTLPAGSTGLQTLPEVARDGYTFNGWFYQNGNSEVEFAVGTSVVDDLTVTAKWTLNHDLTVTANTTSISKIYDAEAATFSVSAEHKAEDATYTYQWYKGDPADPTNATKLTGATNSSYSAKNVTDNGDYFCEVTVTTTDGSFVTKNSDKITVTITPQSLDDSAVADIDTQYYRGSAVEPDLDVADGSTVLVEGTDYIVSYSNNTDAGTATATVTFQGNYTGTAIKTFNIVRNYDDSNDYSAPTYAIEDKTAASEDGTVTIRPKRAEKGDTVSITVTPDAGHKLDELIVTDKNGNELKVTDKGNGKYTFTMPASKITVKATFEAGSSELPFRDVTENDWFYSAVEYAYANDIMIGTGATTFAPNADLNRAMVVQVLYNLDNSAYANAPEVFLDALSGDWFYSAVNWAAAEGIVAGYGNGLFGSLDSVTREQLAVILYNYANSKGYPVSSSAMLGMYTDAGEISAWAVNAMEWAVANKILLFENYCLDPTDCATRAEVAHAMMYFCQNIVK